MLSGVKMKLQTAVAKYYQRCTQWKAKASWFVLEKASSVILCPAYLILNYNSFGYTHKDFLIYNKILGPIHEWLDVQWVEVRHTGDDLPRDLYIRRRNVYFAEPIGNVYKLVAHVSRAANTKPNYKNKRKKA
jgi:hypothetical protein